MNLSISKIANAFIDKKITTVNNNDKHQVIFAIKNFFYQLLTLGIARGLYEIREENKKELFNISLAVFKFLPEHYFDFTKGESSKEIYSAPDGAYKIYQEENKLYISALDPKTKPIELAAFNKKADYDDFKKIFNELKQNSIFSEHIDQCYNKIMECKVEDKNLISHLGEMAINYAINNDADFLNHNSELKSKLNKKSISLEEYIKSDDFAPDVRWSMVEFFLINKKELMNDLLRFDIDKDYMFEAIDEKIHENDVTKKQNFSLLSRTLKHIQLTADKFKTADAADQQTAG